MFLLCMSCGNLCTLLCIYVVEADLGGVKNLKNMKSNLVSKGGRDLVDPLLSSLIKWAHVLGMEGQCVT